MADRDTFRVLTFHRSKKLKGLTFQAVYNPACGYEVYSELAGVRGLTSRHRREVSAREAFERRVARHYGEAA